MGKTIEVDYFGLKIITTRETNYIATDNDGEVWGLQKSLQRQ